MLWFRADVMRLEGQHEGSRWSIETYRSMRGTSSTHVRKDGRLAIYAKDEAEALRYVEQQTGGKP